MTAQLSDTDFAAVRDYLASDRRAWCSTRAAGPAWPSSSRTGCAPPERAA